MKVRFRITQKDIREGLGGECRKCPVALAIARRVNQPVFVSPTPGINIGHYVWDMPIKILEFVTRFDWGMLVQPMSFTLDIPKEFLR